MKHAFIILLTSLMTTQVIAMGKTPEPYQPSQWREQANAEKDAALALENNDLRLLGYTTRAVMIPGIDLAEKEILRQKCGLRMIKGFGDVVRSEEQLAQMKAMREYAEKYNNTIAAHCRKELHE